MKLAYPTGIVESQDSDAGSQWRDKDFGIDSFACLDLYLNHPLGIRLHGFIRSIDKS